MAKHDITHTCGHVVEHNLTGASSTRTWRLTRLAAEPCWECQKRAITESAREQEHTLALPLLLGSEGQVNWARNLRIGRLAQVDETITRANAVARQQGDTAAARAEALCAAARAWLLSQTAATFWIEHRDEKADHTLSSAMRAVIARDPALDPRRPADAPIQPPVAPAAPQLATSAPCQIGKLQSGRIYVVTPYHPQAVERFRNLMGVWGEARIKDSQGNGVLTKAWLLAAEHRPAVEALISELWPPTDQLVERVYRYHAEASTAHTPTLDGLGLLNDYGRVKSDVGVAEVIENAVRGIHGRRSSAWQGTLVVRVRVRPAAAAEWEGGTVELVSERLVLAPAAVATTVSTSAPAPERAGQELSEGTSGATTLPMEAATPPLAQTAPQRRRHREL